MNPNLPTSRFVFPYKGVNLLWELIGPTKSGTLCKTVSGIHNGKRYFTCGASALFEQRHLDLLLCDIVVRSGLKVDGDRYEDTRRHPRQPAQTLSCHA